MTLGILLRSAILGIALALGMLPVFVAWRLKAISADRAAQIVGLMVALFTAAIFFLKTGTDGLFPALALAIPISIIFFWIFCWFLHWLSEIPPDALYFGDRIGDVPPTKRVSRGLALLVAAVFSFPLVAFIVVMAVAFLMDG